jgi:CelD/BcsL family acetyltransferase involved in cellulose biosynthesis
VSGVVVSAVSSWEALARAGDAWERLHRSVPTASPMTSAPWVTAYLRTCLDGRSWTVLLAHRDGELVGVQPLLRRRTPVGPLVRLPSDTQTSATAPLVCTDAPGEVLEALLAAAVEAEPGLASLRWREVRPDEPALAALDRLPRGWRTSRPWSTEVTVARTDRSWEEALGGMSTNVRRNLRRTRKRAERDHGVEVVALSGREAGDPRHLDAFLQLEYAGWKGRAGTAVLCSPQQTAFYRALTEELARRDRLEWHQLLLGGRVAAVVLGVRSGRRLVMPKIAYAEEHASLGPGQMLVGEHLRDACERPDVDEVDFVSDAAWHRPWATEKVPRVDVVLRRPGVRGAAEALAEAAEPRRRGYAAKRRAEAALARGAASVRSAVTARTTARP